MTHPPNPHAGVALLCVASALASTSARAQPGSTGENVVVRPAPDSSLVLSVNPDTGIPVLEFVKLIQRLQGGVFTFDAEDLSSRPPIVWTGPVSVAPDQLLEFAEARLRSVGLRIDRTDDSGLLTIRAFQPIPGTPTTERVFQVRRGASRAIARALSDFLAAPDLVLRIVVHELSDRILVRSDTETMPRIERLVATLDRPADPVSGSGLGFDLERRSDRIVLRIHDPGAATVEALLLEAAAVLDRGIHFEPESVAQAERFAFAGALSTEPEHFLQLVRKLLHSRGFLLLEDGPEATASLRVVPLGERRVAEMLTRATQVSLEDLEGLRGRVGLPLRTLAWLPNGGAKAWLQQLRPLEKRLAPEGVALLAQALPGDQAILLQGLAPELASFARALRDSGAVGTPPVAPSTPTDESVGRDF